MKGALVTRPTSAKPRITFGMIVLNGEPFTRYNLRSLYPHAHQIIVAEGATSFARGSAREDGHSRDGTLETLRRFQREEDPLGKITVVTAEDEGHPNGFWPGEKNEMSQAYARRATGDWLWQVDADEFYRDEDFLWTFELIKERPAITVVTFAQYKFFATPDYYVDGPFMWGRVPGREYHRLFRWAPGYRYTEHRPPTVVDERGRDLRGLSWADSQTTGSRGIRLFHYSMLFPSQVAQKSDYYLAHGWPGREQEKLWREQSWDRLRRPFHVHNVQSTIGWVEHYRGSQPGQALRMWQDIRNGDFDLRLRPTSDIELVIRNPLFRATRTLMRLWPADASLSRPGRVKMRRMLGGMCDRFDRYWSASH